MTLSGRLTNAQLVKLTSNTVGVLKTISTESGTFTMYLNVNCSTFSEDRSTAPATVQKIRTEPTQITYRPDT